MGKAPRNWGKNGTLIFSMTTEGMEPSMSFQGSSDTESFGLYIREVLALSIRTICPLARRDLLTHRSRWVRDLTEE